MRACDIMLKHKNADTVCAVAKNIGRDGEEYAIMSLAELKITARICLRLCLSVIL